MHRFVCVMCLALLSTSPVRTEPLPAAEVDALSANLRGLVVQFLPDPLYQDVKHWGGQKMVADGIVWRGKAIGGHPEVRSKPKNDGTWWRIHVTTPNRGETLALELRDWQAPAAGKVTFAAHIALNTEFDYERQV